MQLDDLNQRRGQDVRQDALIYKCPCLASFSSQAQLRRHQLRLCQHWSEVQLRRQKRAYLGRILQLPACHQ